MIITSKFYEPTDDLDEEVFKNGLAEWLANWDIELEEISFEMGSSDEDSE